MSWNEIVDFFVFFNVNPMEGIYYSNFEKFRNDSNFFYGRFLKNLSEIMIENYANDQKISYFHFLFEFSLILEKITKKDTFSERNTKFSFFNSNIASYKLFNQFIEQNKNLNLTGFYFSIFGKNKFDKMFEIAQKNKDFEIENIHSVYDPNSIFENFQKIEKFEKYLSQGISTYQLNKLSITTSKKRKHSTIPVNSPMRTSIMKNKRANSRIFENENKSSISSNLDSNRSLLGNDSHKRPSAFKKKNTQKV